jgi:hypothetical protein
MVIEPSVSVPLPVRGTVPPTTTEFAPDMVQVGGLFAGGITCMDFPHV